MAKPITIPNTFASATSAIPLSQLDQDFSTLANATNDLATYSNYVADTGAADAYIANFPANTNTSSLTAGLTVQFKAANANTGASTLNVQVNGSTIGTAAIRYANGSALAAGAIAAGAMVSVMYDGTNFQLINDPAGQSGGDVTGPASATDNAIARFDGTSGKLIQNSVVTIADTTGDMSGVGTLSAGNVTVSGTANAATLIVTGNSTLGDASGDTLTITGTTVTTPNGLNFDSNTFVIDATNNRVGVNNATPTTALDVTGTATISTNLAFTGTGNRITGDFSSGVATRVLVQSSTTNGGTSFSLISNGTSTNSTFTAFAGSDAANSNGIQISANGSAARLVAINNGTSSAVPITFGQGNTEQMRIDTSGDVGIGTSSPTVRLQVTKASDCRVRISNTSSLLEMGAIAGQGFLQTFSTDALVFYTGGANRFNIQSGGAIGINNSTPGANNLLTVGALNGVTRANIVALQGSSFVDNYGNCVEFGHSNGSGYRATLGAFVGTGAPFIGLCCEGGTNSNTFRTRGIVGTVISNDTSGSTVFSTVTNANADNQTATERMRIDSSGNVGIGTSSPTTTLFVNRASAGHAATFYSNGGGVTTGFNSYGITLTGNVSSGSAECNIVYGAAGGGLAFNSWNGTTQAERMRITSGGNVGIGNSSPNNTLSIQAGTASVRLDSSTGTNAVYSQFVNTGGSFYVGRDNSTGTVFGAAYASVLFSEGAYPMNFYTAGTERMRITSAGDLLVGTTTSQGEKATFQSATISSANIGIVQIRSTKTSDSGDCALAIVKNANDSTTAQVFVRFGINGYASGSGQINANGASAAAFGSFSDIRLKENITDLPSQLANITALRPVEFDYKDGSGHQIGFIAQEMQKVYPDVVSESNDGMLMLTGWSKTEARLVKAIQEQQAMIVELTNRIKKLEGA